MRVKEKKNKLEKYFMIIGKKADKILNNVFNKIIPGKTEINPIYDELERRLKLDGEPWTEKISEHSEEFLDIPVTIGHLTEYVIEGKNLKSSLLLLTNIEGIIVGKYLLKSDKYNYTIEQRLFEGIQEAGKDILK